MWALISSASARVISAYSLGDYSPRSPPSASIALSASAKYPSGPRPEHVPDHGENVLALRVTHPRLTYV